MPNFSLSALLVSDIWRGLKIKLGAADLPRRHLADKFLYRALVLVNVYKCAKFHLSSSINDGDMQGVPKKRKLLISPDAT